MKNYQKFLLGSFVVSVIVFFLFSIGSWSGPFGGLLPLCCGVIAIPVIMIGVMGVFVLISSSLELINNPPTDQKKLLRLRQIAVGLAGYAAIMFLVTIWRAVAYGPEHTVLETYFYSLFISLIPYLLCLGLIVAVGKGMGLLPWLFGK